MKHFFIINPTAGKGNTSDQLADEINTVLKTLSIDYEIQTTLAPNDATVFVRAKCEQLIGPLRFYACGGDGTLNEVVRGAVGFENASIGCIPCGTGNDFVKNFGLAADFFNIRGQIEGRSRKVDIIKIQSNGEKQYSINVCNIGLDANIANNMIKFKKVPFLKSGTGAYTLSAFYSILQKMGNNAKITIDDDEVIEQASLLTVVANGVCYGGGYYAAPLAKVDDGILDFCTVKNISFKKILGFIKYYKKGEHLNNPSMSAFVTFRSCKKVEFAFGENINFCVDGEVTKTKGLTLEVLPKAINFIVPSNITSSE